VPAGFPNGNDRLYGGNGNDTLIGGIDDDFLSGGAGDDRIQAMPGDQAGTMLFTDSGKDTIEGGDGFDTVILGYFRQGDGVVTPTQVRTFSFDVVTTLSGIERFEVYTGAFNDRLTGGDNADVLQSGGGADTLEGGGDDF
jgi:Ca2+-binding RTX toxin-like protein